jgi:hypothetical protein
MNKCSKCDKSGHDFKNCKNPTISYGIILIKLDIEEKELISFIEYLTNIKKNINAINFEKYKKDSSKKNKIKYLMITRRHSLGYIEFIRGRYSVENTSGLISLFQQMTQKEIDRIGETNFDKIWNDFWNNTIRFSLHDTEYNKSKFKYIKLVNATIDLNLDFYVKNVKALYEKNEIGFAKGRKSKYKQETDMECALREFEEETGVNKENISIVSDEAIIEYMTGTNGLKYQHNYYLAIAENDCIGNIQYDEVESIYFLTFNEAIENIRPYHIEKKNIITKINYFIDQELSNFYKIKSKSE